MENLITLGTFFLLACVTSLVLTSLVRELAPRLGLTDRPDGHRKLHKGAMPLAGGIAILLATVSVLGVALQQPHHPFQWVLWQHWPEIASLVGAGMVIVVVGLVDDRFGLRGWQKLIGQTLAVSVLIYHGLLIERIGMFGLGPISLQWLAIPATIFWLLGAINALNLLDGIDGLATVMGIILVSTLAVMAMMMGRMEVAVIGFIFAGCLVGFMRFNFPPATIYLGDTGSMLIGLVVGTLAIQGSLKGAGTVLLAAPLAVWAIPIFDSIAAVLRRKLTGRSIYTTDRAHLHHRLLNLLGSNRRVLALLAFCCTLTSAAALTSVFLRANRDESDLSDLIGLMTCVAILIIFIATGVFGRTELMLVGNRLRTVGRSLVGARKNGIQMTSIRLQGAGRWETLWETFTEAAEKLGLCEILLDINYPAEHEEYHASWKTPGRLNRRHCWRVELPFLVGAHPVGHLVIVGQSDGRPACEDIQKVLDMVEPFESQLATPMVSETVS